MDEKTKDEILEQLLGEVDNYTGTKLPGDKKSGVEISIMVTPHGDKPEEDEEEEKPEEMNEGGEAEPKYGDFLKSMGC